MLVVDLLDREIKQILNLVELALVYAVLEDGKYCKLEDLPSLLLLTSSFPFPSSLSAWHFNMSYRGCFWLFCEYM